MIRQNKTKGKHKKDKINKNTNKTNYSEKH